MNDYSYLYCNLLEAEVFLRWLQWFKQYVMDMETPMSVMANGGHPIYLVQLPTHNQSIPVAHWKVEELPIDRPLTLDIISLFYLLFSVYIEPQDTRIQVRVYGRNTSASAYAEEHAKIRRRLEWDWKITKEMYEVWAKQIASEQPTEQETAKTVESRERLKKKIKMRIKTGLIRWASERVSRGPEYMCGKGGLPVLNTYSDYKKYQLIYTDEDIAAMGTKWQDLYGAWERGENKLDKLIEELLLQKPKE